MLVVLEKESGIPIYRQVVTQVRQQVLTGQLKPGARLTSVKQLARRLQVNPMTISKAYSLLEVEGVVERRKGLGLFVLAGHPDRIEISRLELIEGELRPVVIRAHQLQIEEDDVVKLLRALYRRLAPNKSFAAS